MPVTNIQARTPYDHNDDILLTKYIATYCPEKEGRCGNELYKELFGNADGLWPWAKNHPWQSWRDRYYKNKDSFDARIKKYQKKHGMEPRQDNERELRYSRKVELEQRIESLSGREMASQTNGMSDNKAHGTSQESTQKRRTAARKTTAFVNGTAPTRSTAVSRSEITDAPVDLSSGNDESDSDSDCIREGIAEKRKFTNETGGRGHAKKRRTSERAVQCEDLSLVLPNGAGMSKVRDTLKDASVGSRPSQSATPQSNGRSQSQLVKKIRESFGALDQLSEEQRAQLLRELRLSIALRGSSPNHAVVAPSDEIQAKGGGDQELLYPDLSQDLDYWDMRATSLDAEGKLNKSSVEQHSIKQHSRKKSSSSSTDHIPDVDDIEAINGIEASATNHNKVAIPKPARKVASKRNDDDFFGTPEPPSIQQPVDAAPSSFAPTIPSPPPVPNGTSDHRASVTTSPANTKEEPLQLTSGASGNDFSGVNGQQSVSKNGIPNPDPSSDSDTSVIESSSKQPEVSEWPPRRNRLSVQSHGTQSFTTETSTNRSDHPKGLPIERGAIAMRTQAATKSIQSPASSLRHAEIRIASTHIDQASSAPNAAAGPSRIASKPSALARLIETRSSYKTPTPGNSTPSVPSTSASDPFITADHVRRLRLLEKGKVREVVRDDAKSNRRLTFGGFSAKQGLLPEVDLKKKGRERNRFSLDWKSLSAKAVSPSRRESIRRQEASGSAQTRRTSFATTIDLAEDIPSPAHGISPADQVLINRAGLQFFVQAMAQNHGVSEEWVLRVYEECRSLPETDRILGEMRGAAERAFEEAIERDNKGNQVSAVSGLPSRVALADELLRDMGMIGEDANEAMRSAPLLDREHEVTSNGDSASQPILPASQHRAGLNFTPTDPQMEYKRALGRYAPPSSSRAARYVRKARQSSGIGSSPLKPTPESSRAKMDEMIDLQLSDDDDKADEIEVENSPALIRPQAQEDALGPPSANATTATNSLPIDRPLPGDNLPSGDENIAARSAADFAWSLEEDAILECGEDEEAMQAIIEKRGKGAVRRRLVELMSNDTDLFA